MRCQSGNRGLVCSDWSKNQILRGCDDKGTFIVEVHVEFEYIPAANTNRINLLKEQKQDIRYIDEDIVPSSCTNGKKLKLLWSRIKALGKTKKYLNTSPVAYNLFISLAAALLVAIEVSAIFLILRILASLLP